MLSTMLCRGQGPNLGKVILCPRTVSETLCRHGNDWLYNDCRLRSHCLCVHLLLVYFNCFHRILLSLYSREKEEKAWQATGNVIRLVDEKWIQNELFTATIGWQKTELNDVDEHRNWTMTEYLKKKYFGPTRIVVGWYTDQFLKQTELYGTGLRLSVAHNNCQCSL